MTALTELTIAAASAGLRQKDFSARELVEAHARAVEALKTEHGRARADQGGAHARAVEEITAEHGRALTGAQRYEHGPPDQLLDEGRGDTCGVRHDMSEVSIYD